MKTIKQDSRTVLVNDSHENLILLGKGDTADLIRTYIFELTSAPAGLRRAIDSGAQKHRCLSDAHVSYVQALIDVHREGLLLLTPRLFTTGTTERVGTAIATRIVQETPLGRSMDSHLGNAGLYGFIDALKHKDNRTYYQSTLMLIMASLCMATHGADDISELPFDAYAAWLDFFRNDAKTRWKMDLWNSSREVAFKCLRELTFAYGRHTGKNSVTVLVAQKRTAAHCSTEQSIFWADLVNDPSDHIRPWLALFHRWRCTEGIHGSNQKQMFMHLARWLSAHFTATEVRDVPAFMSRSCWEPRFAAYMEGRRSDAAKRGSGRTYLSYLNCAKRFSEFLQRELQEERMPAFRALVTEAEIRKTRNDLGLAGHGTRPPEAKARPLPMRLYKLTQEILLEGENGWPGRSSLCKELVWRDDGSREQVYCPVLPLLFLSIFHLPLRVGQMKRLDSGEGDVHRFDGIRLEWGMNKVPTAGYWRVRFDPEEDHGYPHRFEGTDPPLTGISVNTNKTGDPYVAPWQNADLHRILYELRLWQEQNNPTKAPIGPDLYVDEFEDTDEEIREEALKRYPKIFPLFRLPVDPRSGRQGCPPNARRTNEFWQHLMAELERRWNAGHPHEAPIRIVKRQKSTGQPYGSKYNPHGMRVAGLTLLLQQGVPIEIVSKLVMGHKTILMTLYYAKFEPETIHRVLQEAAQQRDSIIARLSMDELKSCSFEVAQQRAAFIAEDGLRAATAMDQADKMFWIDVGIGICPWDGTRCHDGGPLLRKQASQGGKDHSVYAPVEGGERNCVLCRHLISGPAWRTPLWLYGTKLLREFACKAQQVERLQHELNDLYEARHSSGEDASVHRRISRDIGMRETELNAVSREQETIAKAVWNTHRLIEACFSIETATQEGQQSDDTPCSDLVAHDRASVVEYLETSDFEQSAILTAASRVYPILHDAETERDRDRFLDNIMWQSGGQPLSFAPLDAGAKRRGQDALAALLLERVKREEREALETGAMCLQDLRLEGEVAAVISEAVGTPIRLPARTRQRISARSR